MFALKAIRTVVWGTPAPPKPRERPVRRKKRSPKAKRAAAAKEEQKKEKPPANDAVSKQVEQLLASRVPRPTTLKSLDPIPFRISQKPNIFDPSYSSTANLPPAPKMSTAGVLPAPETGTPNRPSSPTKGILVTPGTALNRKKAVSFHPSISEATTPPRNGHIRSGLPHEFPGKFPSPWTPRLGVPQHKRSISVPGPSSPSRTLTFEDGPLNLDKGKGKALIPDKGKRPERSTASNPTGYYEVGEDSRITDYLEDSDDENAVQQLQREVSIHEGNLTTDLEVPRSSSGKFWKERTQKIEDAALEKVDRLRTRCKIATGYAKKKDELCTDLAERMREVMEKNKRLKAELKRLNQQSESTTGNFASTRSTSSRATGHGSYALEEALHLIEERDAQVAAYQVEKSRMESVLQEHKQRVETYEELLNTRENKITELSMSMYNGDDDEDLEVVVAELKKKLRTAKQEARELDFVKLEARGLRERAESQEQIFADVMAEKEKMERELERLRADNDEINQSTTSRRFNTESRLKQQIDALEKSKRELTKEMREKTLAEAKERRELERKTRSELGDMRLKLSSIDKLEYETKELKEYTTRLEREFETTKKVNEELRKRFADQTPTGNDNVAEWQVKQRTTLQELRRVKEETSTLRVQKVDIEEQLESARKDIAKLKVQLDSLQSAKPVTAAPESKELESASDDSAVDRSFDRWTKIAATPEFPPRGLLAMSRPTTTSTFNSPPVPALANRQNRLFPGLAREENHDIASVPLELPSFMQTPKATDDSTFYQQRRQRESPRAKIVNIAVTPPASSTSAGRKVSGVGKVVPKRATSNTSMDPVRKAAAEKRLAERKKARLASTASV